MKCTRSKGYNYIFKSWFSDIYMNPILKIILGPITWAFYLVLDVWKEDIGIIKDHIVFWKLLFIICITITILSMVLQGIYDLCEGKFREWNYKITQETNSVFKNIVDNKIRRFRKKSGSLKSGRNIFKTITLPEDQIGHILDGISHLFRNYLEISDLGVSCFNISTNNRYRFSLYI